MKWTKDQQAAIMAPKDSSLDQQTLLVAAAAGSGKTAVLVERIIQRLQDHDQPLSIQELLVVTFTKAAAAEMSARIGVALAKVLDETGDTYLERQLQLLPSAHISTLHSFCQWVIRSYFYHLDMDPSFRIGSEGEMQLLKQEVLDLVTREAYESNVYSIVELADMFSDGGKDVGLQNIVLRLYHFAMAQAHPKGWLKKVLAPFQLAAEQSLLDTPWGQYFWQDMQEQIVRMEQRYERMENMLTSPYGPQSWSDKIDEVASLRDTLRNAATWDDIHTAVVQAGTIKFSQYRKNKAMKEGIESGAVDAGLVAQFETLGKQNKAFIQELATSVFALTQEEWQDQLVSQQPLVEGLLALTEAFMDAFQERKNKEGLLDFSDLEHRCLALLTEPGTEDNPQPSAVALELQDMFQEVMVDEYQDTNGVQEAIVNLVSRKDNRFYVGDVKQSIYGFRMADSTLFMNKYNTFGSVDDVERRIDLAQNFRSDEAVLLATNFLFYQIMTASAVELTYGQREALVPGRIVADAPPEWVGGEVHVDIIDCVDEGADTEEDDDEESLTNEEKEWAFIIQKIWDLKNNGAMVQDKDGTFRLMEWRDIAILRRSLSQQGNRMVAAFREAGIPAYVNEATGYFASTEIQTMLALLSIIDNPLQDLSLAAVLHSGLVGLDSNDLGRIRLMGPGYLWHVLPRYVETYQDERVRQFLEDMTEWRRISRRRGVGELIWHIYERKNYVNYVGAMPQGTVRRANVLALYERAKEYEASNFKGLFRFLRFIESLRDSGQDLAMANVVSEADNVVRIMTIHKSKGLEFPVVFLTGAQKSFNRQDQNGSLLLHKQAGLGLKGYYPEYRVLFPTLSSLYTKEAMQRSLLAEEQRILYVALTRARDVLYITGVVKNAQRLCEKWCPLVAAMDTPAIDDDVILQAHSYLDWIVMGWARHLTGGNVLRQLGGVEEVATFDLPDKRAPITVTIRNGQDLASPLGHVQRNTALAQQVLHHEPVGEDTLPDFVVQRFDYTYGFASSTTQPAKISVSELKRRFIEREEQAAPLTTDERLVPEQTAEEASDNTIAGEEPLIDVSDTPFGAMPLHLQVEKPLKTTGTQWGTLMHEAMQWLPIQQYTKASLTKALDQLVLTGHFTDEERQRLNVYKLLGFFTSDVGQRLIAADRIEREWPFSMLYDGKQVCPDLQDGEKLFLQGIIDTAFVENGTWVLVDYKTDRIKTEAQLVKRYAIQMALYKEALEQLTHMSVAHTYIYSFHLEKAIEL